MTNTMLGYARFHSFAGLVVGTFALAGCGHSQQTPMAPPDAIPPQVAIAGGSVTEGAAMSTLRSVRAVSAMAISRTPTTVAQYRRCVEAGACGVPEVSAGTCRPDGSKPPGTYARGEGGNDVPLTCATVPQAKQYCAWVGGRLPRPHEWMLAARGPDVKRFAWGDAAPTCEHSVRALSGPGSCCGASCNDPDAYVVLRHPKGDSPSGVSDVLLTRTELLDSDDKSVFPACHGSGGCAVTGVPAPGIDHVVSAAPDAMLAISGELASSGFRCVWEGAKP